MRTDDNYIRTFTGKKFWPLDPRPEDICIEDIAHAQSNLCRFAGHSRFFYAIAQHSTLVADVCMADSVEAARCGLLHDASEAYLLDLATPIKHSPELSGYLEIERGLQGMIYNVFGLDIDRHYDTVKAADVQLFHAEMAALMTGADKHHATAGGNLIIVPQDNQTAKRCFLEAFYRLFPERGPWSR